MKRMPARRDVAKRLALGSSGSLMSTDPVTATRWKLEEARFFLSKLNRHYYDRVKASLGDQRGARPDFEFYLSAFLSASRSVTWVMGAEYGRLAGWKEWFSNYPVTDANRDLLKGFNALRVKSEKVGQPALDLLLRFEGSEPGPTRPRDRRLPRFRMSIFGADALGNRKALVHGQVYSHDWALEEFEGQPLPEVAGRYFHLLEGLVGDCERTFGEPTFAQSGARDAWGISTRRKKTARARRQS